MTGRILALSCVFLLACGRLFGEETEVPPVPPGWNSFKTSYFTVYYHPDVDLDKVEGVLGERISSFNDDVSASGEPAEKKIGSQLDLLFVKAEEILDMRPADMRVNMRIYKVRSELNDEYRKIFGSREDYKSFYINKFDTIYISEEDISDSVIAHEMGHAIVDHYFSVVPPEKVRELLASYVDLHLAD